MRVCWLMLCLLSGCCALVPAARMAARTSVTKPRVEQRFTMLDESGDTSIAAGDATTAANDAAIVSNNEAATPLQKQLEEMQARNTRNGAIVLGMLSLAIVWLFTLPPDIRRR